jgi:hypothetical protein
MMASDAVTLRVMEEAAGALNDRWYELRDTEPEVADGLRQLEHNFDEQAAQLRRKVAAYA